MADVHNRTRYLAGCRCDDCKAAQSEYARTRRLAKKAKEMRAEVAEAKVAVRPLSAVPSPAPVEPPTPQQPPAEGETVLAVRKQIAGLAGADDRPGQVAIAVAMAKILDRQSVVAQHPQAAARLAEVLEQLAKGGRKKRGKLAAVREMTAG